MNLIDGDQKAAVEKSLRELRAAEAVSQFTATNKAIVTLVGNQHSVASVRSFLIVVRYAALEDVPIDALETTVTGTWDRRGLYGISGVDPAFQEIAIESRVSTSAPDDKVAEIARRTHRSCPSTPRYASRPRLRFGSS
jgi:hypothetical protein